MDHPSLDAIAERIARLGRRDSETAVSAPPTGGDQWRRIASLVDDSIIAMTSAMDRLETRNREAILASEGRAAKALDAVSQWLEKQDGSQNHQRRSQSGSATSGADDGHHRDQVLNRMITRLTERLEQIDERLFNSQQAAAEPLRATVQNVAERLERVGRTTSSRDDRADVMGEMLKDLETRIRHLQKQLDQEELNPPQSVAPQPTLSRFQCDQTETIQRLERQLSDVLVSVQGAAAPKPRQDNAPRPLVARDFAATVTEIEARQKSLDADTDRRFAPLVREVKGIKDVAGHTQEALRDLQGEIGKLANRFNERSADPGHGQAIQGVEAQIRSLNSALSDLAPRRQVAALEGAVQDLMDQISGMRAEGMRETDLQPIERLLTDIRLGVETYREPQGLEEINREISALRRQVERGDFAAGDRVAIAHLEEQLADIRQLLGKNDQSGALRQLEQRIGQVSESMDRWQREERSRSDDSPIHGAIDQIRGMVGSMDPSRAIADVEHRLGQRLMEQARQIEAKIETTRRARHQSLKLRPWWMFWHNGWTASRRRWISHCHLRKTWNALPST